MNWQHCLLLSKRIFPPDSFWKSISFPTPLCFVFLTAKFQNLKIASPLYNHITGSIITAKAGKQQKKKSNNKHLRNLPNDTESPNHLPSLLRNQYLPLSPMQPPQHPESSEGRNKIKNKNSNIPSKHQTPRSFTPS